LKHPLNLRTDTHGRVDLGPLQDITRVSVRSTDIALTSYLPGDRKLTLPTVLHLAHGEEIRLPLAIPAEAPDPAELSLVEHVGDADVRGHFDKMSVENGRLVIRDLPPGDHLLRQGDQVTRLIVSSGRVRDG